MLQTKHVIMVALGLVMVAAAGADDWCGFRGLAGDGRSESYTGPLTWSSSDHVAWKTAIPGRGHSSPIVSGKSVYVTTAYESATAPLIDRFWTYAIFVLTLLFSMAGLHCAAQYAGGRARHYGRIERYIRFFLFLQVLAGVSITILFGRRLLNPEGDPTRYWLVWVMVGMACLFAGSVLVSLHSRLQLLAALLSLGFAAPTLALLRNTGLLPPMTSPKGMIVASVSVLPLIYGLALLAAHVVARRWRSGWARGEDAGERTPAALWPFVLAGTVGLVAALMPFLLLLYRAADYQMPDSYIWNDRVKPEVSGGWVGLYGLGVLITIASLGWESVRRRMGALPLAKIFFAVALSLAAAFLIHTQYVQKPKDFLRAVVCLDRESGEIEWICEGLTGQARARGRTVTHASATPVTDGQRIYAYFGADGLMCVDKAGQLLWKRAEAMFASNFGVGTSLVLKDDILVVVSDVDASSGMASAIMAFDGASGDPLWRTERAAHKAYEAYSTPVMASSNGRDIVVVQGWRGVSGYDLQTGEEGWSFPIDYEGKHLVASPICRGDRLYLADAKQIRALDLLALEAGGDPVLWCTALSDEKSATPVEANGLLFVVTEFGRAACLDVQTGEVLWQERLRGRYYCSVMAMQDRVFFTSEAARTTAVAIDREYRPLAVNTLEGSVYASMAPAGHQLFVRTTKYLCCLEETGQGEDGVRHGTLE